MRCAFETVVLTFLLLSVECSPLQDIFKQRRCLPTDRQPMFSFGGHEQRSWLLELNSWTSHRVVASIAGILLREHVGYSVEFNSVSSTLRARERVAKMWSETAGSDGDAVMARLAAGESFGYANMEVWPSKRGGLRELMVSGERLVDAGPVGFEGQSGWWISEDFARNQAFAVTPEFYRAYDARQSSSKDVLQAVRNTSSVFCLASGICCCGAAEACDSPAADLHWCPEKVNETLPAVLAMDPSIDAGFNEEIARSNGFRFALRFVGKEAFTTAAMEALNLGPGGIVHMWRPSQFLTRARLSGMRILRLMIPSEDCGTHKDDGTGDWSCDFPSQQLQKLVSLDVKDDAVVSSFFSHFQLPEKRVGGLLGGGIQDLLEVLSARNNRSASDEEIFETACEWVLANEDAGVDWSQWVRARRVPFFADTLDASYPFPMLVSILIVALSYIAFLEYPWLWTTLSWPMKRNILDKNKSNWLTDLDVRFRSKRAKNDTTISSRSLNPNTSSRTLNNVLVDLSPKRRIMRASTEISGECKLDERYWEGLATRSQNSETTRAFWSQVNTWVNDAQNSQKHEVASEGTDMKAAHADRISFVHYTFPCLQRAEEAVLHLRRQVANGSHGAELIVEIITEECDGGAKAGRDFEAKSYRVTFPPGKNFAMLRVPVVHHKDVWQNSFWFQARLSSIEGSGVLAAPACATILVLDEDTWPDNIPASSRTGKGISLLRYFLKSDRRRRGEKFTKTMIAMVWLPVHPLLVSTLVQKILVDHAVAMISSSSPETSTWGYFECLLLVCVQLVSLGLNRWADVVQTRNRGRTGGIRQVHRADMMRKFMHLERSEYWEASDASWLYSVVYDVDVITGSAYFQVFVLAQSCFALCLSILLVLGLAAWSYAARTDRNGALRSLVGVQTAWYVSGVFIMIFLGFLGVWMRMKMIWVAVVARKLNESAWFKSCVWVFTNWRPLIGLGNRERVALEKRVLAQNGKFVPSHWDARDTMNDTAWVTHWIQGVAYCIMLVFGVFALVEYQAYGIGAMEVGTFYALCKIYLSVGKYIGRLSHVFVSMQKAVVSLRDVAALLNQTCQKSQRREAERLLRADAYDGHQYIDAKEIHLQSGLCFVRPDHFKVGSNFSELKLEHGCSLPLGRLVHVECRNERVLRSFLGLASQVIFPTGESGQDLPPEAPSVLIPPGLTLQMVPTVPVAFGTTAPSITEQLSFTGAPKELCVALVEAVGLEPDRETASLGPGSSQVFSLVRALLLDPDVLCAFRPLALVPCDVRQQVAMLLRLWQGGGGLERIAKFLGVPHTTASEVYRSPVRTLILGNSREDFPAFPSLDVTVDLDKLLWRPGDRSPERFGDPGIHRDAEQPTGHTSEPEKLETPVVTRLGKLSGWLCVQP